MGPGIQAYFCVLSHLPREYWDQCRSRNQIPEGCIETPFIGSNVNPVKQKDFYWVIMGRAGACWTIAITGTRARNGARNPFSISQHCLSLLLCLPKTHRLRTSLWLQVQKSQGRLLIGPAWVTCLLRWPVRQYGWWQPRITDCSGEGAVPLKEGMPFLEERRVLGKQPSAFPGTRE